MTYTCDPSTQEPDVGQSQDQPGLPTRILSQKLSIALPRQLSQKGTIFSKMNSNTNLQTNKEVKLLLLI